MELSLNPDGDLKFKMRDLTRIAEIHSSSTETLFQIPLHKEIGHHTTWEILSLYPFMGVALCRPGPTLQIERPNLMDACEALLLIIFLTSMIIHYIIRSTIIMQHAGEVTQAQKAPVPLIKVMSIVRYTK